jgi:Tol biopolymer transport system component
MPLTPGARVGSYDVAALIGAGGMGEVYRARDTKLNRDVALKILPPLVANDPDRLARFRREAQVLAALNDPHIAQIYGFEDSGHTHALVMELVEGPTLAQQIAQGALPVTAALAIARQIAAALDTAHEHGIVHRDLKPANVKVREDGTVKVLDFGLAKALAPAGESNVDVANSPTMSAHATELGMILGTAAYMAPEQARGRPVDKRADIWAFGVVLFEMLTGRQLFTGETVSDTLAAVLRQEIDWTLLPAGTPTGVRRLLQRCLERDRRQRLRDIGDAAIVLETPDEAPARAADAIAPRGWRSPRLAWTLAALASVVAAALAGALVWTRARDRTVTPAPAFDLAIIPPDGADFGIGVNVGSATVSPDGTTVAFIAPVGGAPRLWIRSLSHDDAHPLPGTDNAYYPFWAPDSRRIAFFANGRLLATSVDAGLPSVLAPATLGRGGAWTDRGVIIFAPVGGGSLFTVSDTGGDAKPLTTLDTARGENAHYWPVALPGTDAFLYFVRSAQPEHNGIYFGHLDGRPATRVISSLSSGLYAPGRRPGEPGYLLWAQDRQLLAQPLDIATGTLTGAPSTVAGDVAVDNAQLSLYASVSRTGDLVWVSARAADTALALVDRSGRPLKTLPLPAEAQGEISQPLFSPDGTKILFTHVAGGSADIWLHDLTAGATSRVTSGPGFKERPEWSPDGRRVAYKVGLAGSATKIVVQRLDGATAPLEIPLALGRQLSASFTFAPDGLSLIVAATRADRADGLELHTVPLDGPPPAPVAFSGASSGVGSRISIAPDGRWIAFGSVLNGKRSIFVARLVRTPDGFTLGAQRVTIAGEGGTSIPVWRRDGREITYAVNGHVLAASVTTNGDAITIGPATSLFATASSSWPAMSPDGTRFAIVDQPNAVHQTLHVLTNWYAQLGHVSDASVRAR